MCSILILQQPNYEQQFFLATDASAYGVGAVLLQEGEINPRTKKTHSTSNKILLKHFYTNRTKL